MDSNIRRVLVLAGGGCRGYLQIKWLQKFYELQNITDPLYQIFDVIAGTSAGALNGVSLAYGKTLTELETIYTTKLKNVFTIQYVLDGGIAVKPSLYNKLSYIPSALTSDVAMYRSPEATSNFGHNVLHQTLVDNFGTKTLQDLKTNVLVPIFNRTLKEFSYFSNFTHDAFCYPQSKIVDVLRGTSAAPVYLPKYTIKVTPTQAYDFDDGGVFNNFPATLAIDLAKMLKPIAKKTIVLYLGTGKEKEWVLTKGITNDYKQIDFDLDSTRAYVLNLFNLASYGFTEAEMLSLKLKADYTLEPLDFYGFDPLLTTKLTYGDKVNYAPEDYALDNSDPDFFEYLAELAKKDFQDNNNLISIFKAKLYE